MGSPLLVALNTGKVFKFEHLLSYSPGSAKHKVWSITWTTVCWCC